MASNMQSTRSNANSALDIQQKINVLNELAANKEKKNYNGKI